MNAAVIVAACYAAAQMLADILSLRIVIMPILGMPVDAGTYIYPFTFTLRDMVQKTAGVKAARLLIIACGAINIVMAGFFWLTARMKPDTSVGPQAEFGIVLNPVWRIVFASIVAEVLSELMDTEAYTLWVTRVTEKYQWMRVLFSNAISIPIDSVIFCWLAFGGVLPSTVVWGIVASNILIKVIMTFVSIPGIYIVPGMRKA